MAQLSSRQLSFLKSQGISPGQVFDASRSTTKANIELQMEALELFFYFGGAACRKGGHTLRTKAGHCIECDTSRIAYQLRQSASGYVYLAYSKSKSLAKVGFTKNPPSQRIAHLCHEGYATAYDWQIQRMVEFKKDAGKKEFQIHALLEAHLKAISYEKQKGHIVECREVFTCPLSHACNIYDRVVNTK